MCGEVNKRMRNLDAMEGRLFLSDEELNRSIGLIFSAHQRFMAATQYARSTAGLSLPAFNLLSGIHANPGITVKDLRADMAMTIPSFARLLGELDRRGLIEKKVSPQDARRRKLFPSAAGKALLAPIEAIMRDVLRPAFQAAGAENVRGLRHVLKALAEAL